MVGNTKRMRVPRLSTSRHRGSVVVFGEEPGVTRPRVVALMVTAMVNLSGEFLVRRVFSIVGSSTETSSASSKTYGEDGTTVRNVFCRPGRVALNTFSTQLAEIAVGGDGGQYGKMDAWDVSLNSGEWRCCFVGEGHV